METMRYTLMPSPVGTLLLAGQGSALSFIRFGADDPTRGPGPDWVRSDSVFEVAKAQLTEYFDGRRRHFDLALRPTGTPFQLAVLEALQTIPYGETRSYADIAAQIGRPKAVRAVGAANGRNPLPIVIPCHRVIGSDGSLTGFGGGIEAKRRLLALEADGALGALGGVPAQAA